MSQHFSFGAASLITEGGPTYQHAGENFMEKSCVDWRMLEFLPLVGRAIFSNPSGVVVRWGWGLSKMFVGDGCWQWEILPKFLQKFSFLGQIQALGLIPCNQRWIKENFVFFIDYRLLIFIQENPKSNTKEYKVSLLVSNSIFSHLFIYALPNTYNCPLGLTQVEKGLEGFVGNSWFKSQWKQKFTN